eukprot:381250-Rhodomonas_salina.1
MSKPRQSSGVQPDRGRGPPEPAPPPRRLVRSEPRRHRPDHAKGSNHKRTRSEKESGCVVLVLEWTAKGTARFGFEVDGERDLAMVSPRAPLLLLHLRLLQLLCLNPCHVSASHRIASRRHGVRPWPWHADRARRLQSDEAIRNAPRQCVWGEEGEMEGG